MVIITTAKPDDFYNYGPWVILTHFIILHLSLSLYIINEKLSKYTILPSSAVIIQLSMYRL